MAEAEMEMEVMDEADELMRKEKTVNHVTSDNNGVASDLCAHDKPLSANKEEERSRLLKSAYIAAAYFSYGMFVAVIGPAFLDLIKILQTNVETGAILFTIEGAGYMVGTIIIGFMIVRCNRDLLMFVSVSLYGAFSILMPWCVVLPAMASVTFVRNLFAGGLDTVGNAEFIRIWRGKRNAASMMQCLHFFYAIGGIIAPLLAEHFIVPRQNNVENSEPVPSNSSFNESATAHDELHPEQYTSVQFVFLILGIFAICTSIPFLVTVCGTVSIHRHRKQQVATKRDTGDKVQQQPLIIRFIFVILLGLYFLFNSCLDDPFAAFLMTFVVTHLGWTKSAGARVSSAFWGTYSAARLASIIIARYVAPWKMLTVDFIIMSLSLIGLVIWSESSDIAVWVCCAFYGASVSTVFPNGFLWTNDDIMIVGGKMSSFFLVCTSTGSMANAALIGYLFDNFSPMGFIYLTLAECGVSFILFMVMSLLIKMGYGKIHQTESELVVQEPDDFLDSDV